MTTRKFMQCSLAGLLVVSATTAQAQAFKSQYMVIDLSGGPDAKQYPVQYTNEKPDLDFDTCRTKELWLRLIQPGTFMMGSPADELGRHLTSEDLHRVSLTQPFYIGVFEVTQKQYELVMDANPSTHKGDVRPVENVSYEMLRGVAQGALWPSKNNVDTASFFGKLRAKTGAFADLPTEAQWEYACRAGTTTALHNGKNLTTTGGYCPNMAEVARYGENQRDGKGGYPQHTKVGMYLPNAWDLYDMHGNVREWCLDWFSGSLGTSPVSNPKGAASGNGRVMRGNDYDNSHVNRSRSAHREWSSPLTASRWLGFRVAVLPAPGQAVASRPSAAQPTTRQPGQPVATTPTAEPPKETVTLGTAEEALAATCAEFKAVWDTYKTNAEKINAEFQPKVDALQQQYGKALETLKGTVQRRGDLEKTQAVVAEIERFEETKTLPPAPDEDAIAEIKTLQANYIRPFAVLEKDKLARMATLTRRYGQALEQLQTDLVRAGKLTEAAAVKEARERAKRTE